MKSLIFALFLIAPRPCAADTFVLQDGTRMEGEVTGDMDDTLLVRTRYGSLTIKKADVRERIPSPPEAEPAPSTGTVAAQPAAGPAVTAPPPLTFATLAPDSSSRRLVYFENGVAVATETYGSDGALSSLEGTIPDGSYTEYYPEGRPKTVKTMLAGKANGTLRSYYPSGALQVEANYLAGEKEGSFSYFTEGGALLMEAGYSRGLLNGWKKEYGPDGAVTARTYYADNQPATPPGQPAAPGPAEAAPEAETAGAGQQGGAPALVTATSKRLARGERFSFRLNDKYVGKIQLDNDFNLMRIQGKFPDGTVKFFSKEGQLQKEFVFEHRDLVLLRVFDEAGKAAEYAYEKDKAVKK